MNDKISSISHEVKIVERNILSISGISRIISFDSTEFILESNKGAIYIKGESLELLNLNTNEGTIKIKGKVDGFNYVEKGKKSKEESFITKLFK